MTSHETRSSTTSTSHLNNTGDTRLYSLTSPSSVLLIPQVLELFVHQVCLFLSAVEMASAPAPAKGGSQRHQVFYPKLARTPPFSVEVPGAEAVEGETKPRRNPIAASKLRTTPEEGVRTIFDIVKRGAEKFGNANAVGSRSLVKTHSEVKKIKKMVDGKEQEVDKKWTYFELSGYNYMSFVEYEKLVLRVGSGLRSLGMNKGDRLHIYAATR